MFFNLLELRSSLGASDEILVLGFDCSKCKVLLQNLQLAMEKAALPIRVRRIEDVDEILSWRPTAIPSLVIRNKLHYEGKVPDVQELIQMLHENFNAA